MAPLALIGFTTLLVGFSEELLYRGFVLRTFLKHKSVAISVLTSALMFSLLYSVNYFGGLAIGGIPTQLVFTFLYGLFAGFFIIKLNNLWPVIIHHWLYDFVLITKGFLTVSGESTISLLAISASGIYLIFLPVATILLLYLSKGGKSAQVT